MRARKLLLRAAIAAVMLFVTVQAAVAGTISENEQRYRAVWTALRFAGSELSITCPVTLEGSFHSRSFTTSARALVGYVTRATLAEASCSGGRVRLLSSTLPWHVQYESFSGTLPMFSSLSLRALNAGFSIEVFGVICLYRASEANPIRARAELVGEQNGVAALTAQEGARIPKSSGGILCPSEGTISGGATMTKQGSSATYEFIEPQAARGQLEITPASAEITYAYPQIKASVTLRNRATRPANNIIIKPVEVLLGGFEPEEFRIVQNSCTGANFALRPERANSCTIEVELIGGRPSEAILLVGWDSGGVNTLQQIFLEAPL